MQKVFLKHCFLYTAKEVDKDEPSGEVIPKAVGLGQDDFIPWKRGVSL